MYRVARQTSRVDLHLGVRVRLRRQELGLTLQQLAAALGMTFQQVQRYECGVNRISDATLYEMSCALHVEINYFFDTFTPPAGAYGPSGVDDVVNAFLAHPRGMAMAKAFPHVRSDGVQKALVELTNEMCPKRTLESSF